MNALNHFLTLQQQLHYPIVGKSISITRKEIAELLFCTERNVVHIIHNLQELGWIEWKSGRGRGNASSLTLKVDGLHVVLEQSQNWIEDGDLSKLFSFTDTYFTSQQKQEIYSKIPQLFGYHELNDQNKKLDGLTFPYFRQLFSLDPAFIERQSERHLVSQCFDTLVEYNLQSKQFTSKLAHYWTHEDNYKKWTFYLRKGVLFHDGSELTSSDVGFTFIRLVGTPSEWIVKNLSEAKEIDSYTIQFQFSSSNYYLLELLSSPKCSIIPRQYGKMSFFQFQHTPIGSGPFFIKERTDESLTFEAHKLYYFGRPHLDKIVMIYVPDIHKYVDTASLKGESISYFPFLIHKQPSEEFNDVTRNHLSIKYVMWNMNKNHPETTPIEREFLKNSFNKNELIRDLGVNRAAPTDFMSNISFVEQEKKEKVAIKTPLHLKIMTYDLVPNLEDLNWLKAQLEPKGIILEILVVSFPEFLDHTVYKEADLFYSEYVIEENELVSMLSLFQSKTSMVHNALTSELNEQIQTLLTQKDGLRKAEALLLEEHNLLPIYSTSQRAFFHENIKGATLSNVGLASFKDLFL